MKKERILLIGGNYLPEPTGIGKYNGEMITWLANNGYDCVVLTTYPYYPHWKIQAPYQNRRFLFKTERNVDQLAQSKIIRCPHYIPKHPTGLKRILSDVSFVFSAFWRIILLCFDKKFDYVIAVAPPFKTGLLGLAYKSFRGAKLIYHVQDLQIDAAQELGMIKTPFLINFLLRIEKKVLEKSDFVSTISNGMALKLQNKIKVPVILFPNWTDTKKYFPISNPDSIKKKYGFKESDKIVLYSGAIGEKQGLENLVYAASAVEQPDIKFVICGSGPYKEKLMNLSLKMKTTNVIFFPLQPQESFNEFLNMADVHLILQKSNANDLVMPSKLATILAVGGLAVITASKKSSLWDLITINDMGMVTEPENLNELLFAIRAAVDFPQTHLRNNARNFAVANLTIDMVMLNFLGNIIDQRSLHRLENAVKLRIQNEENRMKIKSNDILENKVSR